VPLSFLLLALRYLFVLVLVPYPHRNGVKRV